MMLYTPNFTSEAHLQKVIAKMREYGSPEITIVSVGDGRYVALEGSHRMRAAAELKIPARFLEVAPDSITDFDDISGYEEGMTARELAQLILSGDCGLYDISGEIPVLLYDRGNECE